jgi:hypothetical protein
MKRLPLALAFVVTLVGLTFTHAAETKKTTTPKAKAPNPVLAAVTDVPGLPRVLLIGDSISMGYTLDVPMCTGRSRTAVTRLVASRRSTSGSAPESGM